MKEIVLRLSEDEWGLIRSIIQDAKFDEWRLELDYIIQSVERVDSDEDGYRGHRLYHTPT